MKYLKNILVLLAFIINPIMTIAGDFTKYVNPLIGTSGHGHVFLGANVPFGLVQLGPTEPTRGWDWCSGYHYSDSVLLGFSHMHLSGTGIGDLGDISLLPVTDTFNTPVEFSHENESVRPGYYSLFLPQNGIKAELTATQRCGFHRYSFPVSQDSCRVLLDLNVGIGWDNMVSCFLKVLDATKVAGYRQSKGWANNQKIFFVAEFSKPITIKALKGDTLTLISTANDGMPLLVKVGLSPVNTDNAQVNLQEELSTWNFDQVAQAADEAWERQLSKIKIATEDEKVKRIFYTAMYHTMIAPSVFCDVNGDYRGADGKVYGGHFDNYTTFSLWDTYRAAHPLMTLIHPNRQYHIAQSMLHIFKEQRKLPVWHLMGNETNCMVGNPCIPALVDIALKGYDVDVAEVLASAKKSAMADERGLGLLREYGYLPYDLDPENETVSKGLEYALADYCVARVASMPGSGDVDGKDFRYFMERSKSYLKYFDAKTRFMRARDSKGQWREPFDPFMAAGREKDYTEGNAWQYLWLVPHDVKGLIRLLGGDKSFVEKLDSLFILEGNLGVDAPPDVSGLIGQYAHGNEPSHHVIYLYNFAGMPWKAAPLLRRVMYEMYDDSYDGLCGNEDVGQMSAWYVLSAMGLYQVEPAGGRFVIGSPIVNEAEMKVRGGKVFKMVVHNNSPRNIYVQHARLNGKKYTKSFVDFKDIVSGATLELFMGEHPSKFGSSKKDRP